MGNRPQSYPDRPSRIDGDRGITTESRNDDPAVELLKSKAILLLRRERELYELRTDRDRVESWLNLFHSLSEMLGNTDEQLITSKSAAMLIDYLGFESVVVYRHDPERAELCPVSVQPAGRTALPIALSGADDHLLEASQGADAETAGDDDPRIAEATGLAKYFWQSFPVGASTQCLLVTGFSPNSADFHTLSISDAGHFVMFGYHLAALLSNAELVHEVSRERHELVVANDELDASLRELRKTQEELVQSTRLASVGEMAGRLAHEVLNPVASIRGRITKMMKHEDVYTENVAVLGEIVEGWLEAHRDGGLDGLVASLSAPVPDPAGGERALLEDDLDNLMALRRFFGESRTRLDAGLQFLLRETDRVTRIIDGTRSLTRASSSREAIPVIQMLKESSEILFDGLEKRNIRVEIEADDSVVLVDRYELIQVLTNLMRNSMFAIEDGSGRAGGTIRLCARREDDKVEIRVQDTGTGISSEHLPLIFESTFTTRSAQQGTGLGLSICKRLVRGFGGELDVEWTETGTGTCLLIVLPACPLSVIACTDEETP